MSARTTLIVAALMSSTAVGVANAASVTFEGLTFTTDAPQSAWNSGPGFVKSETIGVSTDFEGELKEGEFSGSATAPNPAYIEAINEFNRLLGIYENDLDQRSLQLIKRNEVAAANAAARAIYDSEIDRCDGLTFGKNTCRAAARVALDLATEALPNVIDRPTRPEEVTLPQTIDTRIGESFEFNVAGTAELSATFEISAGTVDPELKFSATLDAPDEVEAGDFVDIAASAALTDGAINATTPTFGVNIEAGLQIDDAGARVEYCTTPGVCTTIVEERGEDLGVEINRTIFEFAPEEIKVLGLDLAADIYDEFGLPDEYGRPSIEPELTLAVELDLDTSSPTPVGVSVNNFPIPPDFGVGVGVDAAEATLEFPVVDVEGALEGQVIKGRARDDYVTASIDIDTALSSPGGLNVGNFLYNASGDLYDITGSVFSDLYQDLEIVPELNIRLDFDRMVNVEGVGDQTFIDFIAGAGIPRLAFYETTLVTPTFSVIAALFNETGFQPGLAIGGDVLKGQTCVGFVCSNFGPVAEYPRDANDPSELTSEDIVRTLFDERVELFGFDTVKGNGFEVVVRSSDPGTGAMTPVPLPAPAVLLLGGLATLSGLRRKRRQL